MQGSGELKLMKQTADKYQYLRRARRRFLAGTGCTSPDKAVTRGERSVEEWADLIREELERQTRAAREPFQAPRNASGKFTKRLEEAPPNSSHSSH